MFMNDLLTACTKLLFTAIICCLCSNCFSQRSPVSWDQFEIKTKNGYWLYSIEFYKGNKIDSIRLVNLKALDSKAYSIKIPISSTDKNESEVKQQLSAEFAAFDKTLPKLNESVVWSSANSAKLNAALKKLGDAKTDTIKPVAQKNNFDTLIVNPDKQKSTKVDSPLSPASKQIAEPHGKLTVQFASNIDIFKSEQSGNKKDVILKETIIVPKQKKDQKYHISIKPDYDNGKSDIADSNVFIAKDDFVISQDSSKADSFTTNILIRRDSLHERSLYLKLAVFDSLGNKTSLCDVCNEKIIYIEKYKGYDSTDINHEFWLFVGTNLDLVDGIQAQDLYFRADYLTKIKKNQWFFISLGKNRYFDYTDSVYGVTYANPTYPAVNDSIKYTMGHFNGLYVSKTENLFFNLKYLFQFTHDNKNSNLFFEPGIDLQYLTVTRYWRGITLTDSSSIKVPAPPPNMPNYFPYIVTNFNSTVQKSWNYNFSAGLMHIFNQDDLNIKTQLIFGLDYTQYPKTPAFNSFNQEIDQYSHNMAFFTRFRIDATVLNPGISLGFEIYTAVQKSTDLSVLYLNGDKKIARPLFNISLTKVLDIKHIKNLLGGVTPISNTN